MSLVVRVLFILVKSGKIPDEFVQYCNEYIKTPYNQISQILMENRHKYA